MIIKTIKRGLELIFEKKSVLCQ